MKSTIWFILKVLYRLRYSKQNFFPRIFKHKAFVFAFHFAQPLSTRYKSPEHHFHRKLRKAVIYNLNIFCSTENEKIVTEDFGTKREEKRES